MQRKNMRLFTVLLALCTLIAMLPVGVYAEETTTISEQQLFLGDDLTMHFYGEIAQAHQADAEASISVDGEAVNTYTVSQMTAGEDGTYDFFVDLGAAQMTDPIVVSITSGGAEVFNKTYSVRDYMVSLLNASYTSETKQLVKEVLNYGAMAQKYFDHHADTLANAGYVIEASASIPTEAPAINISGQVDGASFYGATMLFRSKTAVRFYFVAENGLEGYNIAVTGNTYTVGQKDGVYYIEVANIMPQDIDQAVELSVSNGEESLTVSYSPMNYIVRMYNKSGTSENLKNLLVAANSYFAAAKKTVVAMDTILNGFADLEGVKLTYLNNANVEKEANAENGGVKLSTDNALNVWIASWTKANSLQFYAPIQKSKTEIKSLLDAGYTELTISVKQGFMNQSPWWGLTNNIRADWTDTTYTIKNTDGMQALYFSLQDLYDNYDAIAAGTMALLKFDIDNLTDAEGGFTNDKGVWTSTDYNIMIQSFKVVDYCRHEIGDQWESDGESHWKSCSLCGDLFEEASHGMSNWITDENGHHKACTTCGYKKEEAEHTWETIPGGQKCSVCGYEDMMPYVLNDFADTTGVKVTYEKVGDVADESTAENGRITISDSQLNVWIPAWTQSDSLEFHMPLKLTKDEVKALLDYGATEFAVTIKQSFMNDSPWWALTNNVSADWTDATYAVKHTDDFKTLTFSLQDLYDNYEALSDGTMALFKFSIAGLAANDGGVWDGVAWVSSSYNIWIGDVEAVFSCVHSAGTEWESDGENHWKVCTLCGEKVESAKCSFGQWITDENDHYQECTVCGSKQNEGTHNWETVVGGKVCADCGREDMLPTVLNDFTDLTGVKVTYLNNSGDAKEANAENGGAKLTAENNLSVWIAPWTRSKSMQFYVPLNLTKAEVKALLDLGCTEFTVSLDQTFMNESPWWGLTNTISADWTDATYSVAHDAGWVEMSFSLQDLYDHYDAINSGEMAMFRFAMSMFSETDGGFWDGSAWVSSSHNIYLSPITVKLAD